MAAVAPIDQSEIDVVRVVRSREVVAVAGDALRVGGNELPYLCTDVAAPARRRRVHPDEREPRAVVERHLSERPPGHLRVALLAVTVRLASVHMVHERYDCHHQFTMKGGTEVLVGILGM